jgi:hypothetical protein
MESPYRFDTMCVLTAPYVMGDTGKGILKDDGAISQDIPIINYNQPFIVFQCFDKPILASNLEPIVPKSTKKEDSNKSAFQALTNTLATAAVIAELLNGLPIAVEKFMYTSYIRDIFLLQSPDVTRALFQLESELWEFNGESFLRWPQLMYLSNVHSFKRFQCAILGDITAEDESSIRERLPRKTIQLHQ